MAIQSPYLTVYEKESGVGKRIYRASLAAFLKTGRYQQERPANATDAGELARIQLPVAGREANRTPLQEEHTLQFDPDSLIQAEGQGLERLQQSPIAPSTDAQPKRSQPRRRAKAAGKGEQAEATNPSPFIKES